MGIPENHAKHALFNTGNDNADVACGWYFENMENSSIIILIIIYLELNEPLRVKKNVGSVKSKVP